VGGLLAARLAIAGHDVEVVARGATLERIREHGISIRGAFGRGVALVAADERLRSPVDLAIVATKLADTVAAVAPSAPALADAIVVSAQNGLIGPELVERAIEQGLGPDRPTEAALADRADRRDAVLGALALFAVTATEPGRVTATAPGDVSIGRGTGPAPATARTAANILAEAVPARAIDDFEHAQWTKLLVNHVNPLPAVTASSVQEVGRDERLRAVLAASMRESIGVARATGAGFASLGLLSLDMIERAERSWPDAVRVAGELSASFGEVPNPASTLQSIRRGVPTEIDELGGRVVAIAREHGLDAPVNARLVELVHEVERTGRFRSFDETAREFASLVDLPAGCGA